MKIKIVLVVILGGLFVIFVVNVNEFVKLVVKV